MTEPRKTPLHQDALHESGYLHASGEALYVDDLPAVPGTLVGQIVCSPVARGTILSLDVSGASAIAGVRAVFTAADVPGVNDIAPFTHDEPLLAKDEVHCVGQAVALIIADDLKTCRAAAAAVKLEIEPLAAVLTLQAAIAEDSFLSKPHVIQRGDVDRALQHAELRLEGTVDTGGQDHFYLETHAALVIPEERGTYRVYSSTQHPSEVQAKIAEVLDIDRKEVVVEVPRMGGGFGGKETQGAHIGAYAALGAKATGKPVKVWLNRDQDMMQTGKRHPFHSRYEAAFSKDGRILGLRVFIFSDGGWTSDLSNAIMDRGLFHLDNAYFIPNLYFSGRVARTNLVSNTAFRGFGGPQGMVVIETVMNRAAERLGIDPAELRRLNYYGDPPRNQTPYAQPVEDCRLARIHEELMASSGYHERLAPVEQFNQGSRFSKRGLAFSPVKFGISFTAAQLNQAGALVMIYADGSVQVNHGGTEMGQGLHTKMIAVAAHHLGVPVARVRLMNTATDKVPNTSATAASSGSDLNGEAIKNACESLAARLRPIATSMLGLSRDAQDTVSFESGFVHAGAKKIPFDQVVAQAYVEQVSLAAVGFYRTPGIHYDPSVGRGKPFHYFAYGAAVSEVEINGLTGEHRLLRVDILHDVGHSLVPTVDRGQVEGGFIQGLGWLTCEEMVWDEQGRLRSHSPDTYKIPAIGEAPPDFRVALLSRAPQPDVIHGSKAVGEPPLMLAISVPLALRAAVRAFGDGSREVQLRMPCTPESVLRAVEAIKGRPVPSLPRS